MDKMKKIHPTVTQSSLEILKTYGIKPSEAIEQYALLLVTKEPIIIQKEQLLKDKKNELLDEKKNIEKLVEDVDNELIKINELKRNYTPVQSKQFDNALQTLTIRLRNILQEEENNKWDLKKVSLNEVTMICKENNVSVESVLNRIPSALKVYIDGYTNMESK
ncbi:hypothetical protein [Methanosphaera sp.]|uniref:hypothetical protein n=1 Tax=Methanosphaera sp. TaxID=2666342 RepID=UPI0025E7AE90|nr:hypothetical protein [Methanosphaera sp.]